MDFCPGCGCELAPNADYCEGCKSLFEADANGLQQDPPTQVSARELVTLVQPGDILARRYEILEKIGKGGMGTVFRARDRLLDLELALKVINPDHYNDPDMMERFKSLQRFKAEVINARRVNHPNVCRMHDISDSDGGLFVTMELLIGKDLHKIIRSKERLSWEEAGPLILDTLNALQAVHDSGILHRDLKPANIIVTEDGRAHLTDFGISRHQRLSGATDSTTQACIGTPEYMAPEQVEGRAADFRSDIYAFGCILYEMLIGTPPMTAETPMALLLKKVREEPKLEGEKWKSLPPWQRDIIKKCLKRNPDERFQDVKSILRSLEDYGLSNKTNIGELRRRAKPTLLSAGRFRWRYSFYAVIAALLGLAAYSVWRTWRPGPEAVSVGFEGSSVVGFDGSGNWAWAASMQAPVTDVKDFDTADGASSGECRFIALCGGSGKSSGKIDGPEPEIAIISAHGRVVRKIKPLKKFNPFVSSLPEDRFSVAFGPIEDLDGDGCTEAIATLSHQASPTIIFFISAKEKKLVSAIANTGQISSIAISKGAPKQGGWRTVCFAGQNTGMGRQCALFALEKISGFYTSPDIEFAASAPLDSSYRLLDPGSMGLEPSADPAGVGLFAITGYGRKLLFNSLGAISSDSWFNDAAKSVEMTGARQQFYSAVRKARKLVLDGKIESGQHLFEGASGQATDQPTGLYANLQWARSLRESGHPDMALKVLPQMSGSLGSQGSLLIERGNTCALLGKYAEAKKDYLSSRFLVGLMPWMSAEGYANCLIMEGASQDEIYKWLLRDYSGLSEHSCIKAWPLAAAVLSGDADEGLAAMKEIASEPRMAGSYQEQAHFRFRLALWQSFAEIEAGMPLSTWPERAAIEREMDPLLTIQFDLLEAVRSQRRGGSQKGYNQLKAAYKELRQAAQTEPSALAPYAFAAYHLGFASADSADGELSKEALSEALRLYPYGRLAERARSTLKEK